MPGLLGVSKNAQFALKLALLVVHEHLLPPKIKKLMNMFREYRHIYTDVVYALRTALIYGFTDRKLTSGHF